jgi:glycosyltransferase involved in cell wall biosynthesis
VALFNWERAFWLAQHSDYRITVLAPDWGVNEQAMAAAAAIPEQLSIERYPSKPWIPYPLTHVPRFSAKSFIESRIKALAPDLMVSTDVERFFLLSSWSLPGLKYAQANDVPFIAEYHTDLYNFSASYPGWQWLRAAIKYTQLTNFLYRHFTLTLCATQAAENSCQEMGINNTVVCPYLGIDSSDFSPALRDRGLLLEWLMPEEVEHTIYLYLGRLGYEKKVDCLIGAFQELQQERSDISLLIVGDGPEEVMKSLKQQAGSTKHIHFTGFQLGEKKAKIMASCDVFCSPSPYETFGRTLAEAIASGLPVISVKSGAAEEMLASAKDGLLINAPEKSQMALAMAGFGRLQANSGTASAAPAQTHSLQSACSHLLHLYESVLADRQSFAKRAS